MKKGIGRVLLLVSLILIAYGGYLSFLEYVWDEWNIKEEEQNDAIDKETLENDSVIIETKKKEFLNAGVAFMNAVSIKVNLGFDEGFLLTSPTAAYYLPVSNISANSCVELEKGGSSPFGDWEIAYVIVTLDDNGTRYSYSFTALDKSGYGMLPAREGTPLWVVSSISKNTIPVIPKTGDTITSEILPSETRDGIKAVIATIENGVCIIPDI